jgi:multiple sugar transport system ATP-binding protein
MNFFKGRMVVQNNDLYFNDGANSIQLPAKWREGLSKYKDEEMVLGIRPENFFPKPEGSFAGKNNSMKVKIEVVEPLGDKMDLYMASGSHPHIVCRIDSHSGLKEGQEVTMYVDVNRVHLFTSGDTGVNVTLEQGNGG